jgi:hypothetical protein
MTQRLNLQVLQLVLEASVAKQGEKPLTNAYLLNIVKMARLLQTKAEDAHESQMTEIYNDVMEDRKWGDS